MIHRCVGASNLGHSVIDHSTAGTIPPGTYDPVTTILPEVDSRGNRCRVQRAHFSRQSVNSAGNDRCGKPSSDRARLLRRVVVNFCRNRFFTKIGHAVKVRLNGR